MLVAIAGPIANLLLATAFALVVRMLHVSDFTSILATIVYANVMLAVFNLKFFRSVWHYCIVGIYFLFFRNYYAYRAIYFFVTYRLLNKTKFNLLMFGIAAEAMYI